MLTFLPDVNVWIALAVAEHSGHDEALEWFGGTSGDTLAFCTVTEAGFLRLLTNRHVMKGDALSPREAWERLDEIYSVVRPVFAAEPPRLRRLWRERTLHRTEGTNFWTDAWLAAFAAASGYTLVTFDRGFARHEGIAVKILGDAK